MSTYWLRISEHHSFTTFASHDNPKIHTSYIPYWIIKWIAHRGCTSQILSRWMTNHRGNNYDKPHQAPARNTDETKQSHLKSTDLLSGIILVDSGSKWWLEADLDFGRLFFWHSQPWSHWTWTGTCPVIIHGLHSPLDWRCKQLEWLVGPSGGGTDQ